MGPGRIDLPDLRPCQSLRVSHRRRVTSSIISSALGKDEQEVANITRGCPEGIRESLAAMMN